MDFYQDCFLQEGMKIYRVKHTPARVSPYTIKQADNDREKNRWISQYNTGWYWSRYKRI